MQTPPTPWTRWLPLLYFVGGMAWIMASDTVLAWLFKPDPGELVRVGTIKGFVFVTLTALLWAWWWRYEQRHTASRLKDAEERVALAAQRTDWMLRRASDAVLLLDADGHVLDCNEHAELMYGYSRPQLLALDIARLHAATGPGATGDSLHDVRAQGHLVFEAEHQRSDGSTFPVEVSSHRTVFEGRTYVQCSVRDISERKALERARQAAEVALRDSEKQHRRRIERQRDLYGLLSRCNHLVARVSDKDSLFQSLVRLSVEAGGFQFAWIGELRADGSVAKVAQFGEDGGYVDQVVVSARADEPDGQGPAGRTWREGATVVVNRYLEDASTTPWHALALRIGVRSAGSVPIRALGKVTAVLKLYSTEDDFFGPDIVATLEEMAVEVSFGLDGIHLRSQLAESRNLLQTVIDATATPIYAFDRQGRALLMNQACARLFGRPVEELIGRTRALLHRPDDSRAHDEIDQQVFASGAAMSVEERLSGDDGERVFLSVKFPLRSVGGEIIAVGGVSTEITELRRAQEAVVAANSQLEETVATRTQELVAARDLAQYADRAKTAFLSTVSHELRTPLNSIIGFTDVVAQGLAGPLTDEQRHQLSIVQDSARMLLALINEILDLSRIEAGRLQLEVQDFDLVDLLRRKVAGLESLAAAKGLKLEADVAPDVGRMTSDPRRVAQVVSNLLTNAVKFTERGSVRLRARASDDQVTIVVQDTGRGIAADDLAQIFKPFVQVGDSGSQHHDGTGLGLAISLQLARALGGDIHVQSTPGEGSRFELTLPLVCTASADSSNSGFYRRVAPKV